MITFSCSLDCVSFSAGSSVGMRLSIPDTSAHADHVLAQVDERWSNVTASKGSCAPEPVTTSHAPFLPQTRYLGFKTYIVFKTEREQLTLPSLISGVDLSFDLPDATLPSFSGLAGNILYVLGLSLYKDHNYYYAKFPFHVHGIGSLTFPIQRYLPLCVNVNVINPPDHDDAWNQPCSDVSFAIRHISTLCHATLRGTSFQSGAQMPLQFAFVPNHGCHRMIARLLQCEKLLNDKRLQERAVDTQQMHTVGADVVNINLQLPSTACTFSCPAFKVSFLLEVEFSLLDEDKAKQSFTWSTPIDVQAGPSLRVCYPKTTSAEAKLFATQS